MEIDDLSRELQSHEGNSQRRFEQLNETIKESNMGEGINTDKVIVNAGGSGDGGPAPATAGQKTLLGS